MPNIVTNILELNGPKDKIEELIASMKSEDTDFDFNKIIKMPKSLNIESGSIEEIAIAYCIQEFPEKYSELKAYFRVNPLGNMLSENQINEKINGLLERKSLFTHDKLVSSGKIYCDNLFKYGLPSWYDWCTYHWGTKWNAMDVSINENVISFETAWSNVKKLMVKLSQAYPDIEMKYKYADENYGYNIGYFQILNAEILDYNLPNEGTDEAYLLAKDIFGVFQEEYYGLDE